MTGLRTDVERPAQPATVCANPPAIVRTNPSARAILIFSRVPPANVRSISVSTSSAATPAAIIANDNTNDFFI